MPEVIIGTPVFWAGQQCTVKEGGTALKAVFNEGTYTRLAEMEPIKDERGDIKTRVYHGFTQQLKLTGYPTGTTLVDAAAQKIPHIGVRLLVEFPTVGDERQGYYDVTNAEMGTTNTGNTVWGLDLVYSTVQTA